MNGIAEQATDPRQEVGSIPSEWNDLSRIAHRNAKKIWLVAGAVTVAQGVAYLGCVMVGMGAAMARFDHGGSITMVERLAFVGATVLGYPITNLVVKFGGALASRGEVAYAVILANSLTWGIAAAGIAWWIGRRRHARHGPRPAPNS